MRSSFWKIASSFLIDYFVGALDVIVYQVAFQCFRGLGV